MPSAKLLKKAMEAAESIFEEMDDDQIKTTIDFMATVTNSSSNDEEDDDDDKKSSKKKNKKEEVEEDEDDETAEVEDEDDEDEDDKKSKKKNKKKEEVEEDEDDEDEDEDDKKSSKKNKRKVVDEEDEDDESGDSDEEDYSSMSVKALAAMAKERGLNPKSITKNAKDDKKALVKALNSYDENSAAFAKKSLSKLESLAEKNDVEWAKPRGRATDETKKKAVIAALLAAGVEL